MKPIRINSNISRNLKLPDTTRLTKEELVIDSKTSLSKEQEGEFKLEEELKVNEFRAAKQFIQIKRIQDFFFQRIETHYTVVKDLEHTIEVSTFRLKVPSPTFWELIEQNRRWMQEEQDLQSIEEALEQEEKEEDTSEPVKKILAKDLIGEFYLTNYDISTQQAIKHLEKRLEAKYLKECELAELDKEKIRSWESAADIAAIKHAKENMGDFKLKEGESYIAETFTTSQRRQRIMQLKLEMLNKMHQFNKLVIMLRNEKPALIAECKVLAKRLLKVQQYLPIKLRKQIPRIYELEKDEEPEKYLDISREDLEARIAKKVEERGFKEQKDSFEKQLFGTEDEKREGPKKRTTIPMIYMPAAGNPELGMTLVEPWRPTQEEMRQLTSKTYTPKIQPLPTKRVGGKGETFFGLQASVYRFRNLFFEGKNESSSKKDVALAQRQYKQEELYKQLYKKISYFKNRTLALRGEKVHLELNLKLMQISLMNLFQELDINKEFDKEEKVYLEKLRSAKHDCSSIKEKVDKHKKRVDYAKQEVDKIESELSRNVEEVAIVIGEKKFVDFLWKLFNKRFEQAGSGAADTATMDNDSVNVLLRSAQPTSMHSRSSIISSGSFELSKSSPSVMKLKRKIIRCPEGLDKVKFEKVVELRSKQRRLELDLEVSKQILGKQTKHLEDVHITLEKQEQKIINITKDINELRRRKQERINDIDKVVIVKAHQVQCMDDDKMEEIEGDFEQKMLNGFLEPEEVLVIHNDIIRVLGTRAEEIKLEAKVTEEKLRRARQLRQRVHEELGKKEKIVAKLEETCKNDMIRKFGRVLDLDEVCAAVINLQLLDALRKLESRRNEQFYEQHLLSKEIVGVKNQLMGVTKINSELNTLVAILEERQRDIEYYQHLKGKGGKLQEDLLRDQPSYEVSESREIRQKNDDIFDELDRLDDILWQQEMKVGVLRGVITMCKTKQGIPPIVPLQTIPKDHDISSKYLNYQQFQKCKENRNKDVITIFKDDTMMEKLEKSTSVLPFIHHHHERNPEEMHMHNEHVWRDEEEVLDSMEMEYTGEAGIENEWENQGGNTSTYYEYEDDEE